MIAKQTKTAQQSKIVREIAEWITDVGATVVFTLILVTFVQVPAPSDYLGIGFVAGIVIGLLRRLLFASLRFRSFQIVIVVVPIVILLLNLPYLYALDWTGFGQEFHPPFVEDAKDLWDWLQLAGVIGVPLVVALLGFTYQRAERERLDQQGREEAARLEQHRLQEQERTQRQFEADAERAKDQAEAERRRADRHLSHERLQVYIDRMTRLMLDGNLTGSEEGSGIRIVARAQTLATLPGLDGESKGLLIRFLYEANLIGTRTGHPIISLYDADLRGVNLESARLDYVNLSGANLEAGSFTHARLSNAQIRSANLSNSVLTWSTLFNANLFNTSLEQAQLEDVSMNGALLESARCKGANFEDARLQNTYLKLADFSGTNLVGVDFTGAQFDVTFLNKANLRNALVTSDQLENARMSETTIMPDGSQWIPTGSLN